MMNKIYKLKHLILLGTIALFLPLAAGANARVSLTSITCHLSFKVDKPMTLGYVVDGDIEQFSSTQVGQEGNFAFTVPVHEAGFYYIQFPANGHRRPRRIRLYLTGGLNLQLNITKDGYDLGGKNIGHNALLHDWNKSAALLKSYYKLGSLHTYEDFFPFFKNKMIPRSKSFLAKINTKNQRFNKLMKMAVQADMEHGALLFLFTPHTKQPKKDELMSYYSEIGKTNPKFSDSDVLKLGNGYSWMKLLTQYKVYVSKTQPKSLTAYLTKELTYIDNDALKEVFIRRGLTNQKLPTFAYKQFMEPRYKYMTSQKSKDFLVEYEKKMQSQKGQPGFNFTYKNIKGEPVSFDDLKGKYVYVDIWATWCGPCKKEIPSLKKIEKEFGEKNITFVSISIDKPSDKAKWKKMVKDKNLSGIQLMADKAWKSGIVKNYEIKGIPRFMLFGPKGNIIDPDASRPSNPKLKEQFESLLKG